MSITFLAFFVNYDKLLGFSKSSDAITFYKMLKIPSIHDIPKFYLIFSIIYGIYIFIKLIQSFDTFLLNYRIKQFLTSKLKDTENEIDN